MLVELVASQFVLESALADVANADPAVRDQLRSQLSNIAGLRQQIGTASGNALGMLRGEVTALASNAGAAAQEARTSAASNRSGASSIATLANAARQQTATVMAGMKDFDADLKFADARDEAEYRQRETQRQAYIAAEQAKGTPQGDLNAAGGAVGQMADAAAHGATANPEFQKRWDALTASTEALRAQLVRDGKDVSQFDAHLREDLRAIMRVKGVPDAKIDALLAAHRDNPLDAVKAFVADQKGVISEKEIGDLARKAADYKDSAEEQRAAATSLGPASPIVDAMAKLKASGVVIASDMPEQPAHGVAAQAAAVSAPSRSV